MRLFLAAAFLALHLSTPGLAAVETIDRGPVAGSAEGRVWSRVVDQVGNTQGQAELWHIGQPPTGASLRLDVDAPLAGQMDIRIPWMTGDGGIVELSVSYDGYRTPTGFSCTLDAVRRPDLNPDPVVILYPRVVTMDQTYRISVTWSGGEAADDVVAEPERWNYAEKGQLRWTLELHRSGDALTLVFIGADGQENSRLVATESDGTIRARSGQQEVTIRRGDGYLDYLSANVDGSDPFTARLGQ